LLVEKNGMLGGTVTVACIPAPAHFFAWGTQIIGGIGWELVRRCLETMDREIPDGSYSAGKSKPAHIGVSPTVYAALCDQMVLDAGVELMLHAMPASAQYVDGGWTVSVCTKTGLKTCRAKELVDATGDANVVEMAGFELVRPETVQPASLVMHCSGYDYDALDLEAFRAAAAKAIDEGRLIVTDLTWYEGSPERLLRAHGHNANHVRAHGAETSAGRTLAEVEARRSALRVLTFCRQLPGLENFRIDWMCTEAGIRETTVIKGKETISTEDYESGRLFDDAVCYAYYQIDEHLNDGLGINQRQLAQSTLPTIPRGALLPQGSRHLAVAGRCLSSSREAQSALRVEAPCMAMGQAAGVMAALSAKTGTDMAELPREEIVDELHRHDAIVPPDIDPSQLH
ncbi:MAG: FAD-dependent oxidoreductase, partial [Planctomycetota bacterium]